MRFLYDSLTDLDDRLRRSTPQGCWYSRADRKRPSHCLPRTGVGGMAAVRLPGRPEEQEQIGESRHPSRERACGPRSSSVSTILDVEEAIARPGFRDPKSSSDIGAIMGRNMGEGPDGYLVPHHGPPGVREIRSEEYDSLRGSESLSGLVVTRGKSPGGSMTWARASPTPGGESEALDRLGRKVSDRPDFVNGFSKPATMSTNEAGAPWSPRPPACPRTSAQDASRSGRFGRSAPRPMSGPTTPSPHSR